MLLKPFHIPLLGMSDSSWKSRVLCHVLATGCQQLAKMTFFINQDQCSNSVCVPQAFITLYCANEVFLLTFCTNNA